MVALLQAEVLLFWVAFVLYAVATASAISSSVLKRESWAKAAIWIATVGVAVHGVATVLRWLAVGHGPYITRYEGMSSNALAIAVVFLILQLRFRQLRGVTPHVLSAVLLIMGVAAVSSKTAEPLPLTFQSYWLVVHIWFAKFANGALLLGAACAGAYLYKTRKLAGSEAGSNSAAVASDIQWLDEFSYKLTAFGFVFLALMIGAGSIWANKSWGSYWSWDAIETWSLVTWITYGAYLHLRRTFDWKGRKAALLLLGCLGVAIFSFFFIGIVYTGLHKEFLGPGRG